MSASAPSLHRLKRLHRKIQRAGVPQVVVADPVTGKFWLIDSYSPRGAWMMRDPNWQPHVLGIFTPDVPLETLIEELA